MRLGIRFRSTRTFDHEIHERERDENCERNDGARHRKKPKQTFTMCEDEAHVFRRMYSLNQR